MQLAQVANEDPIEEGVLLNDEKVNKVRKAIYAVTFIAAVVILARVLLTLLVLNPPEIQSDIINAGDDRDTRIATFILGQIGIFFLALAIPCCGFIGAYTINRSFLLACAIYSVPLSIYGLISLIVQDVSGGELLLGCNKTQPCFQDFLAVESLYVIFTMTSAILVVVLRQILPEEASVEVDIPSAQRAGNEGL